MKATIGQEKQQRIQQSSMTTGQLSPVSSSNFSPLMVASFNENLDTQSTGFETDRKSYTSLSRYLSTVNRSLLDRPGDLIADFYFSQLNRNMQENVRHVESKSLMMAVRMLFNMLVLFHRRRSILTPSTSQTDVTLTSKVNDLNEVPTLTAVDPPDFVDRKKRRR
ncbi:unnamed protein product [Rotaria socialis]|uniref:Uncharacterized protein n=1 Tax=Rotaria socialis TaxID=392032 RepID=A0A818Y325_9BILA|nr:unnamed protein product [Rotaria socialis]